jgi:hypothetical protein
MTAFRLLLAAMFVVLLGYTALVVRDHGMNLFAVFFGDMAKLGWPGQFNLDFMFMLMLSGLWVAWRHRFSAVGLGLGLLAFLGGASFLSVYLLVLSLRGSDIRSILLGPSRVGSTSAA